MKEKTVDIVIDSLRRLNEDRNDPELQNLTAKTHLYGRTGNLDSLALVNLIVDVEEKVAKAYGKHVVLADERAMSLKRSPFRTVRSLAEYIDVLLTEHEHE